MDGISEHLSLRALALMLGLAALGARPGTAPAATHDVVTRQLPLSKGGRLILQNSRGNIHVAAWDRELVDLRAEKVSESGEDLSLVPLDIRAAADEVEVTSQYPVYAPQLRIRVDYRLRVPVDTDLKLVKTQKGDIEIAGVRGRAIVQTENGSIKVLGFFGILDATTVNGDINAVVTRLEPGDSVRLATFNGDITLKLPGGAKAHLALSTLNGSIESDTPLEIRKAFGPQVAHESNDVETPLVRLNSIDGNIHLTRR